MGRFVGALISGKQRSYGELLSSGMPRAPTHERAIFSRNRVQEPALIRARKGARAGRRRTIPETSAPFARSLRERSPVGKVDAMRFGKGNHECAPPRRAGTAAQLRAALAREPS
ncbi:MAG: hypothetical protein HYV09_03055 [Deltaproteobacteria bacterium]|nr:hypothetical protein [Deltaproteobacteria bacterium]